MSALRPQRPAGVVAPDAPGGSLAQWDAIVINSSGGKDSQTALRRVALAAHAAGVADRITVQHNDLGRVEWPGTSALARVQAEHYGLRFAVRTRAGVDLLDDVERRGKFPDAARRWCTSDHKRGPGRTLLTALVAALNLSRPARVLHVFGFRAAESTGRARKEAFRFDASASTHTTRHVFEWLPIHGMSDADVWADIRSAAVPYHPAYRAGMRRLSCSFCVLASRADLERACQLRPALAREYVRVEAAIGHTFQQGQALADIAARAGVTDQPADGFAVQWSTCRACAAPVLALAGEQHPTCPMHEPADPWAAILNAEGI